MDAKRCDRCGFFAMQKNLKGWTEHVVRLVTKAGPNGIELTSNEEGSDLCPACSKIVNDALVPHKTATRRASR